MSLATDIDEESIGMSLFRRGQHNQRNREDLLRRARNRRDEEEDDERERLAKAEEHEQLMKKVAARNAALALQAVADLRAEKEALRAWSAGSNDRRDR